MRDDLARLSGGAEFSALQPFLDGDNEVLRCAATRALPRVVSDSGELRPALIAALLDPDPDVRSDAMEALAEVATEDDIPAILRSLEGDPVREVKLGAIAALRRLGTRAADDLMRALVLSRAEDRIAWEDEDSDWEDWLDVQIAAIGALGDLGTTDAIVDMMAARDDEYGQSLDGPVFDALAAMGDVGVSWLVAVISTEGGQAGQRAIEVLARCVPEAVQRHLDILLEADDPRLRRLAPAHIAADEPLLAVLARKDPDATVRRAAVLRAAPSQPDVALRALQDRDVSVQVAGLDGLHTPLPEAERLAIIDNMLAWLEQGPPVLMRASATQLARFAPDRVEAPLLGLIGDSARPLDARVAGATALGALCPAPTLETLVALVSNPAQQVRAKILALIAQRAHAGDGEARAALAAAIAGEMLADGDAVLAGSIHPAAPDVAIPKGDGGGPARIRITRDGEIVAQNEAPVDAQTGGSTLDAILADQDPQDDAPPELAEDTPEESAPKRRKRRAVEGPAEIADALSLQALQTGAEVPGSDIEAALLGQALTGTELVRRAAWQAMARRGADAALGAEVQTAAEAALGDDDPVIRLAAFEIRMRAAPDAVLAAKALRDDDALIRAQAVEMISPEEALSHLGDPVLSVRDAALARLAKARDPDLDRAAFDHLVAAERSDTLARLVSGSACARRRAVDRLVDGALAPRKALVILSALSAQA